MKRFLLIFLCCYSIISCEEPKESTNFNPINWKNRAVKLVESDSLNKGQSYLSVYSQIYSITEHRTIKLTVTVSLRNVSTVHDIYLLKANYYNTKGDLIRTYFDEPIALKPLETIEIIIDEKDKHGGSGANFVFDWALMDNDHEPFFEAVMISTSGQQGISFTTKGIKL
jgi:hypothetical protein